MRYTRPATPFVAQTASSTATQVTPTSTGIVRRKGFGPGSTRHTLPPSGSAAQTLWAPTASVVSPAAPTGILCVIVFVRVSNFAMPCLRSSTTQTPPSPAAILVALTPLTRPTSLLVRGSIRETVRNSALITQTAWRDTAMCCVWVKPLDEE